MTENPLPDARVVELIGKMKHYHTENEKLRQHVTGDEWKHNNALAYSALWADIGAALEELLDRREDEELNRICEERKNDPVIAVNFDEL